jgi:peptide chain release factor 1
MRNFMLEKLAGIEERFEDINKQLVEVGNDYQKMVALNKERADLESIVAKSREYRLLHKRIDEARHIIENESDTELRELAQMELTELEPQVEPLEKQLKTLLVPKDPRDDKSVIVEIRAGAGGDEAGLFASDLFRMYTRYAERQGWKTEMLSANETGIGGFKEVIFEIKGKGAFSKLKYESGVHRVQRVPETEAQGRIHTSTVTVAVLAEVDEVDIQIPESDLEIEVYRSSGAGGQNVQKNSTAVVACQDERSQLQNKLRALSVLRARLYEIEEEKRHNEIDSARRLQIGSGERSEKIRTYNYPQSRVTDHRIGISSYNLPVVMDGDIDMFIDELSTRDEADRLSAGADDDEE